MYVEQLGHVTSSGITVVSFERGADVGTLLVDEVTLVLGRLAGTDGPDQVTHTRRRRHGGWREREREREGGGGGEGRKDGLTVLRAARKLCANKCIQLGCMHLALEWTHTAQLKMVGARLILAHLLAIV